MTTGAMNGEVGRQQLIYDRESSPRLIQASIAIMIVQLISLAAAFIVLYAFFRQQQGRWGTHEPRYLACNFVGTLFLTGVAWIGSQWGFVLIEGIWALVSLRGLLRLRNATHVN